MGHKGVCVKPLLGFTDQFGAQLRRRRYLSRVFSSVAETFGFEPLEVPIVEHARAYDEAVVGRSPWPEWNPAGMFTLALPRYDGDYTHTDGSDEAVLIPEGTLSVTRWLGDLLTEEPNPAASKLLPLKIYYDISCYRNELTNTLSASKGRQFTQFGVEILGSSTVAGDLEVMCIAAEALRSIGVVDAAIAFRISSNSLYGAMAKASSLPHLETIALKEILDTIGECKAGKQPARLAAARESALAILAAPGRASDEALTTWRYVIDRAPRPVDDRDYDQLGETYAPELDYMACISRSLAELGLRIDVDFCVVRSHEYYTGLTFEIDLLSAGDTRAVEVGGGGRYDRLLGNFVEGHPGIVIPSIGYAFGLERLSAALEAAGHVHHVADDPGLPWDLTGANAATHTLPFTDGDTDSAAEAYIQSVVELREGRASRRVSVDVGDNSTASSVVQ
jgi:histidyl-tRNA synthetase